MGFWSTVGNIASSFFNEMVEKAGVIQAEANEISHLSNKELVDIMKDNSAFGSSSQKKAAARYLLKQRGVIKD